MWCVVVWHMDHSGIVMILGPWREQDQAIATAEGLGPFSMGKHFEVVQMAAILVPETVL